MKLRQTRVALVAVADVTSEVTATHELGATAFEHHAGVGQGVGLATSDGHAAADAEVLGLEAVAETRAEEKPHALLLHDALVAGGVQEHELGELPSQLNRVAPIRREIEAQTNRSADRCRWTRGRVVAGVVPSACRHRDGKQRVRREPPVLAEHDAAHHPGPDERADDEELLERGTGGVQRLLRLLLLGHEAVDVRAELLDTGLVIRDALEDSAVELREVFVPRGVADQLLELIERLLEVREFLRVHQLEFIDALLERPRQVAEHLRWDAHHGLSRHLCDGDKCVVPTLAQVARLQRFRV